jgi:RimJ/RimL family protein N-acetyltransferase
MAGPRGGDRKTGTAHERIKMILEGLLVDLVPYGESFKKNDHSWWNGPAAFFWTRGDHWIMTHSQVEAAHQEIADGREQGDPRVMFGIQTKDGTPIGVYTFCSAYPHHRLVSIAVMLGDPAHWGGGYGTDALLLMVDYAFDWLDIHKVGLETMSINARARHQVEKLGFTLEGCRREALIADGKPCDEMIYGLLRDEWPGRAAMIEKLGLRAKG